MLRCASEGDVDIKFDSNRLSADFRYISSDHKINILFYNFFSGQFRGYISDESKATKAKLCPTWTNQNFLKKLIAEIIIIEILFSKSKHNVTSLDKCKVSY